MYIKDGIAITPLSPASLAVMALVVRYIMDILTEALEEEPNLRSKVYKHWCLYR